VFLERKKKSASQRYSGSGGMKRLQRESSWVAKKKQTLETGLVEIAFS
jgi:hypothetical protein